MVAGKDAEAAHTGAAQAGLQAERTDLAWARTGLAFITNGVLILLRPDVAQPDTRHLAVSAAALVLAGFTLAMSHRRRRALARRPLPTKLAAPVALAWLASGTALLVAATLVAILAA